ncbi:MAG: hypothetical protein JWP97_5629 [Labilithrix sp.]|nr:hypothetical protein [Labilithrix sp.]
MKLRTRNGSIRLRLTQAEVATLASNGTVEEQVFLGPAAALTYRLVASETAQAVGARLEDARITVEVPGARVRAWAASPSEVGIEGEQPIVGHDPLVILVEKDFACLSPRAPGEDEGAFPHPAAGTGARC